MTLDLDLCARGVGVLLVGDAELVVADDLGVADLFPLGGTAEMLSHEERVAEDLGVGDHLDKVVGRHGLPEFVQERAVVNADGGCDDFSQAFPVLIRTRDVSIVIVGIVPRRLGRTTCLGVIALRPLKVGSETALVVCAVVSVCGSLGCRRLLRRMRHGDAPSYEISLSEAMMKLI